MVLEWPGEGPRRPYHPSRDDGRQYDMNELHRRPRPMEIADTLNTYCGIPGELYFLAVRGHDGAVTTFFSPGRLSHDDAESSFFNAEKFQQITRQPDLNGQSVSTASFDTAQNYYNRQVPDDPNRHTDRRRLPPGTGDDWDGTTVSARKRPRARNYREDDQDEAMSVTQRRGLKIGDSQAVYSFYENRFKGCQQGACKLMAKAWVKVLAPKKQSTHPYTGSDERAPDWWPKPWGPSKEERVRHKEPDHLYKRERVHLLIHILRLAVEPNNRQLPDLQKLNINVKKLEDATWEALSGWFAESEANVAKKPFISDLFRVAKLEERYKDGMLDGSAAVYVSTETPTPERDEVSGIHEDDAALSPSRTARVPGAMRTERSPVAGGPLVGNLPMRTAPFPPQQGQILEYMPPTHTPHPFDQSSLSTHSQPTINSPVTVDLVPNVSPNNRRGSLFNNFNAPGNAPVFSSQWPQVPDPTHTTPSYTYATQHTHGDPSVYSNPTGVPLSSADHQGYLTSSFDSLPRPPYDPSTMFRQPDMGSGAGTQTQAYPYHASAHGVGLRAPNMGPIPRSPSGEGNNEADHE